MLPAPASDQFGAIAGRTLFRVRSLDGGESVEVHQLTDAACDVLSAGDTTHEEMTASPAEGAEEGATTVSAAAPRYGRPWPALTPPIRRRTEDQPHSDHRAGPRGADAP
jgi:hypothetical protein